MKVGRINIFNKILIIILLIKIIAILFATFFISYDNKVEENLIEYKIDE